jgi:phage FluMu gp28-like protein
LRADDGVQVDQSRRRAGAGATEAGREGYTGIAPGYGGRGAGGAEGDGETRVKPIIPLLAWQQAWIEDDWRFKLVLGASQCAGKSFTTSLDMSLDRLKPGSQSAQLGIILSASERQSLEVMEKVKMHTRAWDVKFEDGYFEENTSIAEHRVIFPNGKRLIALPANPDTARGYSGDLLLDEFALHRDSKAIWAAGMTRVSRGYKCRVASTVKGLNNQFGELIKMLGLADGAPETQPVERNGWHGYWVDALMAVAQGAPVDLAAMREAIGDDDIWQQDFCNVPTEDGSQYIPLSMVLSCESGEATTDWDGKPRPGLCAGYDVARKRDGSVIILGYPVGPLAVICGVIVLSRMPFAEQKKICREVAGTVESAGGRFAMDATGIGMQLGEELSEEFTCVEPVNFASSVDGDVLDKDGKPIKVGVKERMAGILKRRCEDRMIWLPDSVQLRREFQAVKRYVGPTGAVRLDAERTEKGGHADWFWATALLCAALEGPGRLYVPASECGLMARSVTAGLMERAF